MLLSVGLGALGLVVLRLLLMAMGHMRVMGSLFVIARFVMLGGFTVVLGGMLMMISGLLVMLRNLAVGHVASPLSSPPSGSLPVVTPE